MNAPETAHAESDATLDAELGAALADLAALCPGLSGAAVATSDGLALYATGTLSSESAAAAAAFVIDQLDSHLGMMRPGHTNEALIWTDAGPCYLRRIGRSTAVLAMLTRPDVHAAAMRHAGTLAAARLAPRLESTFGPDAA